MAGKLVTIATFDSAGQAHEAKNVLEAAAIRAVVTDEETVSMLWHISTAVGGIKVQVLEEDADRALAVLDEAFGKEPADREPSAPGHEPADEADEPGANVPAPGTTPEAVAAAGAPVPARSREEYARVLFFAAWLGLVFPPLWFVALYYFIHAAFSEEPLSPRGRFNLLVGGLLTGLGFCTGSLLCCGFGGAFR
ncbi:DUF2007 domain-containing protein [Gemmata sp. JC673]|uniref:DUF2007 domain-containing protein n=1 Tax=Gemmata algarum TaxID=2975278 RepID=A0ABU5F044_9BACT|nr:DUF2007 domain-containing protein [Gemmata algarum]MDY3559244.1 DUF2007 domain-containing protein [Gemmata algarum]